MVLPALAASARVAARGATAGKTTNTAKGFGAANDNQRGVIAGSSVKHTREANFQKTAANDNFRVRKPDQVEDTDGSPSNSSSTNTKSRVVAGSASKQTRRARALAERPELLRKIGARERRRTREQSPLTEQQRNEQNQNSKTYRQNANRFSQAAKLVTGSNLKKGKKSIAALAATGWIVSWTWPLYITQLVGFVFWIMGMYTGYLGDSLWLGWLTGSTAEMFIGIGMGIGLLSAVLGFLVAFTLYSIRGVRTFKGHSLIIMAIMISFSLVPLSFLPVVWLWCVYVVVSQGSNT